MSETMREGYNITVRGRYFAADSGRKVLKNYGPIVFFIPKTAQIIEGMKAIEIKSEDGKPIKRHVPVKKTVDGLNAAQHIIQRQMLNDKLKDMHEDCLSFQTCNIVDVKRTRKPAKDIVDISNMSISEMNISQLKTFCNLESLHVPLESFPNVLEARRAVQDEFENRKMAEKRNSDPNSDIPYEEDEPKAEPATQTQETADPLKDLV